MSPINPAQQAILWLIRQYQKWISPMLAPRCRFHPSCSQYAVEAIRYKGVWRGTWLALWRLLRCHPWHPGGYDPVPGTDASGHPLKVKESTHPHEDADHEQGRSKQ